MDERIANARRLYERAVFEGDAAALAEAGRSLDGVDADLALARGRLLHTRFLHERDTDPGHAREDPGELPLFDRAVRLYQGLGDAGARPRHCSGSAASTRWSGGTTTRRCRCWTGPWNSPPRPATRGRCPKRCGTWASRPTPPGGWTRPGRGWRSPPAAPGTGPAGRGRREPDRAWLHRRGPGPPGRRARHPRGGRRPRHGQRRAPHPALGRGGTGGPGGLTPPAPLALASAVSAPARPPDGRRLSGGGAQRPAVRLPRGPGPLVLIAPEGGRCWCRGSERPAPQPT